MNPDYRAAMDDAVGRIRRTVPEDLVRKFQDASLLARDDFHPCAPAESGEVCAVDGSNAVIIESGSLALVLIRAARSTFTGADRTGRSLTPFRFAVIGHEVENQDFAGLYRECFGELPGTPLANEDRVRAAGILRDTVEYWVTLRMAETLGPGAILLRDGPLRVSHASHDTVLQRVEGTCRERAVALAGISKQTTATWGGGHPVLPAVNGLAKELGVSPPWWVRIPPATLDHAQFPQWQHGDMYVASLHPGARSPLKVELVKNLAPGGAGTIMDRLAACSGDGRVPGYPYPLFDAHRTVVLSSGIVEKVRSDLMSGIAEAGIDRRTYEILFGDYHDEFARY